MKRILITGANSYIGTSFEKWLQQYPNDYSVDTVGTRNEEWKKKDFSGYDVVFHVAGIAHVEENKKNADLYYEINKDLAYEVAQKAKKCGIRQFIFLSSMSVYGLVNGVINRSTIPNPTSNYGKSKLQAEKLIEGLADDNFIVAILRPPMVYGKDCKGNYTRLAKLAVTTPIFPKVDNKRSMIYIDNLCEFIRQLIEKEAYGLFFPQNKEYVNTSDMVMSIAEAHGKKIVMTKLFNPLLKLLKLNLVNKVFGDLVYEKDMSDDRIEYTLKDFYSTIYLTEKEC